MKEILSFQRFASMNRPERWTSQLNTWQCKPGGNSDLHCFLHLPVMLPVMPLGFSRTTLTTPFSPSTFQLHRLTVVCTAHCWGSSTSKTSCTCQIDSTAVSLHSRPWGHSYDGDPTSSKTTVDNKELLCLWPSFIRAKILSWKGHFLLSSTRRREKNLNMEIRFFLATLKQRVQVEEPEKMKRSGDRTVL